MTAFETFGRWRYEQLPPIELTCLYADLGRLLGPALRNSLMRTLLVLGATPEPGETAEARIRRVVEAVDAKLGGKLSAYVRGLLERPWVEVVDDLDVLSFAVAELLGSLSGRALRDLMITVLLYNDNRTRGGLQVQSVPSGAAYVPIKTIKDLDEQFSLAPLELPRVFAWALMVNLRPITAALSTSLERGRPSPVGAPAPTPATPGRSTS